MTLKTNKNTSLPTKDHTACPLDVKGLIRALQRSTTSEAVNDAIVMLQSRNRDTMDLTSTLAWDDEMRHSVAAAASVPLLFGVNTMLGVSKRSIHIINPSRCASKQNEEMLDTLTTNYTVIVERQVWYKKSFHGLEDSRR